MIILVTGGAGFIGSHVVNMISGAGHTAVVVDDLSTGSAANVPQGVAFYSADVCSADLHDIFRLERPEIVCHLAAHISVRESVSDPVRDARINVTGTVNVLDAGRLAGVRHVVFASSAATYGHPDMLPVRSAAPLRPRSPYAASKAAGEVYLAAYQALHGLAYTTLVLANVYGPRQRPDGEAGVVAHFADAMLAGRPTHVFGNGTQTRDYVFVGDVATAFLLACGRPGHGDRYNIGTGVQTSDLELHSLVAEATGAPDVPAFAPPRPGDLPAMALDPAGATRLGWSARVPLADGVRITAKWAAERAQRGGDLIGLQQWAAADHRIQHRSLCGHRHCPFPGRSSGARRQENWRPGPALKHEFLLRCPAGHRGREGAIRQMSDLTITVIVPAYNEQEGIHDTLRSVLTQTVRPDRVIVVDDCSTDNTPEVLRMYDVDVLRPPANLGSKARAQNYALPHCATDLVLPVDADTVLAPDYIERIEAPFADPRVVIAAGNVQTRYTRYVTERGRQIEYLFGFHFYRPVQNLAHAPMVCSGCCSAFRRDVLVASGGFPERTLVEDFDWTATQQIAGNKAVYVAGAEARAADPETPRFLAKQMDRWMSGFFQNMRIHFWSAWRHKPMLAFWYTLAIFEIVTAPLWWALPLLLPFLWHHPFGATLAWWVGFELAVTTPVLVYAAVRRRLNPLRVIANIPFVYFNKLVNTFFAVRAMIVELVLVPLGVSKGLVVYHKGH